MTKKDVFILKDSPIVTTTIQGGVDVHGRVLYSSSDITIWGGDYNHFEISFSSDITLDTYHTMDDESLLEIMQTIANRASTICFSSLAASRCTGVRSMRDDGELGYFVGATGSGAGYKAVSLLITDGTNEHPNSFIINRAE